MFKALEDSYAWASLPLRLTLGAIFLFTGIMKVMDFEGTKGMLAGLNFPAPMVFAVILTLAEVFGGAFLVLGFLTRVSSMWLTIVMIVAIVTYSIKHLADMQGQMGLLTNILIIGALVALILNGPGRLSLDEHLLWE